MSEAALAEPPAWVALDWGTSHLRAWAMDAAGEVRAEARSGAGMGRLDPEAFEPALLDLLADWPLPEVLPCLACGMVGARQGWVEAAYRAVPCAPLSDTPVRAPTRDPRLDVRILPGLSQAAPADIMRGEETQIAGVLADRPGFDGVVVLPGSHTKWARVAGGRVVSFQTAMTGEIYAAMAGHTVLRHSVDAAWDDETFAAAVEAGSRQPEALAARAFAIRAEAMLNGTGGGGARLSGLLIGAELAHTRPHWERAPVAVVGSDVLASHYARALSALGGSAEVIDGTACTLSGLRAAMKEVS